MTIVEKKSWVQDWKDMIEGSDLRAIFDEPFVDLTYGAPGSGKTTLIAALAAWLWKHQQKMTHWIVCDGGFPAVQNLGLVKSGAVEFCDCSHRPEPATTLELLCEGYWPDASGKLVKPSKEQFEKVGLRVFEGFGAATTYLMGTTEGGFGWRAGKGMSMGGSESLVKIAQQIDVGQGEKRNYGVHQGWAPFSLAQSILMGCKRRSTQLPGGKIWTTHEKEGEDKADGNKKVIGPEIAGSALTPRIAGHFGNTFHTTMVTKIGKGTDQFSGAAVHTGQRIRRVYTQNHFDPDGTVHKEYVANSRVFGLPEFVNLLTPADTFTLWAELARIKRELRELSA